MYTVQIQLVQCISLYSKAIVKASYFINVEATLIKTGITATSRNLTDCDQLHATFTNTKYSSQHPKDHA